MSLRPALTGPPVVQRTGEVGDRWEGLRTLSRVRLLIALIALPAGVLFRPEFAARPWGVVAVSLGVLGALSAAFAVGARVRRGYAAQVYAHLAADLALVTAAAVVTGGRESQFVMFYALVAITGGLLARVPGGLFASSGACFAILAMPWLAEHSGLHAAAAASATPGATLLFPFLGVVGVLSGVLGDRVQRTRDDLEQTTRELDRVRLDNDAILRHLTSGVLTVDGEGRIAYLNPAAETMLGVRTPDLRGRAMCDALPARLGALCELVEESRRDTRARARAELQVHRPDGAALPLGISTSLLGDAGIVAVFQDLSEVRAMERRARRNETLAEVGALAAGIAHELRNGLKPISGSVEFLQRELCPEGESAVLMELISRECARLNRFVTDLLSYSRERDLAVQAVDVVDALDELVQVVRHDPRRQPGVVVRLEAGPEPRAIRADREQIRQVWLNLAANALEAMPQSGTLTVRWRDVGREQVAVEFEDDGPGIAAEDLPRVGQPFFTTKEGGTGLGVAIAQRIVERHGGTLVFESGSDRRGTIARVTLPQAAPVEAGLPQAA